MSFLRNSFFAFLLVGVWIVAGMSGCSQKVDQVVIYTSLDRDLSDPVLKHVSEVTGLSIVPKFDSEQTKTTGLFLQLLAEKEMPQADVFWNSEVARTIQLGKDGVLAPYQSPQAKTIPDAFKDPNGFWTGFAARARVIIYNTGMISEADAPKTMQDLLNPRWKGRIGVAKPFFGTTATHAAAIYHWQGGQALVDYFKALQANETRFLTGNATVRDMVANGTLVAGLTDTDDVWGALEQGLPVAMIYPDGANEGTLLIPNTVALIKNGPNPEGGRKLIDALLSPETEALLAEMRGKQIPLHLQPGQDSSSHVVGDVPFHPVDFAEVAEVMPQAMELLKPLFN